MKTSDLPNEPFIDDGLRMIFINAKTDIYKGQQVLGPAPIDFYKKKIIEELVNKAVKDLKPTISEKEGYEILSFELIIKQTETPKAPKLDKSQKT